MIAAKIGTIAIGISGLLGRGCFGTLYGHRLVIEYCWVRVHDRRLERFPLRIAGHCLKSMLFPFDSLVSRSLKQLGNSFYNFAPVSRTIYILIFRNFSLFNYLSVNIDITEWFLVPYIFVYYYDVATT